MWALLNNLPFSLSCQKSIHFNFLIFWITCSIDPAWAMHGLHARNSGDQLTLMQAYGIEQRLEMIQFYLGTDLLMLVLFKKSIGCGRNSLYDWSDTEEAPWNALGCVQLTKFIFFCVPFILFILVQFSSHWSESQNVMPLFPHSPAFKHFLLIWVNRHICHRSGLCHACGIYWSVSWPGFL